MVAGESYERALELVRNMESSGRFHDTRVPQEMTQSNPALSDSVQFDISALYVPEAEMDSKRGAR